MKSVASALAILAAAAVFGPGPATVRAAETPPDPSVPSVSEVIDKLNDLYRSDSSHGRMKMRVKTKHYTRELEMEMWTRGEDHALVVVRSPSREAGTATLKTPDGMWNYAPRADRMMRIPTSMLSSSWMGSHFTNEDLMRESSYEEDYDTRLQWATHDGDRVLKATMTPKKNAPVVYTKIVQLLNKDSWLPIQADHYDGKDIVKTMHFRSVRKLGSRELPTVIEVIPTDKPEESTRVEYVEMEFGADVDKSLFTPRGLRRQAQRR